jgi:hypothetical protein
VLGVRWGNCAHPTVVTVELLNWVKVRVKVKFYLEQATKAQRGVEV